MGMKLPLPRVIVAAAIASLLVTVSLVGRLSPALSSDSALLLSPSTGMDSLPVNATCVAPPRPMPPASLSLPLVVSWHGGSRLVTVMAQRPDDATPWLIGDRSGVFYNYREGSPTFSRLGLFADLRARVVGAGDAGLLGAAFHPDFARSGEIYLYYVTTRAGVEVTKHGFHASRPCRMDRRWTSRAKRC